MTGQILAGESPDVASRYQLVIMFLIASSTGAATMFAVLLTLVLLFDKQVRRSELQEPGSDRPATDPPDAMREPDAHSQHRLRSERVVEDEFIVYQWFHKLGQRIQVWWRACSPGAANNKVGNIQESHLGPDAPSQPLLTSSGPVWGTATNGAADVREVDDGAPAVGGGVAHSPSPSEAS